MMPEKNQPKVSQFFKPLSVVLNSSADELLRNFVSHREKRCVRKKELSFAMKNSSNCAYNSLSGPLALSSPARVYTASISPDNSPEVGHLQNNSNDSILLDSESD